MENSIISRLIDQCWYDITSLPVEPTDRDEMTVHDNLYIASVIFSAGTRQGSLTVVMDETLAERIAGNMFNSAPESVSLDDIKDSIGELANVLAGNLKTEYFGDNELSKPVVMKGDDSVLAVFKTDAIFQKTFVAEENRELIIQVCQTGEPE